MVQTQSQPTVVEQAAIDRTVASRNYSRFLARCKLKARHEGIPTPVYALPAVHHLA